MAPRGTPNRGRGRGAPPGTPRGGGRGRGGGGGRGRGRGGGAAMAAQDFTGVSLDYEQLSEAALGFNPSPKIPSTPHAKPAFPYKPTGTHTPNLYSAYPPTPPNNSNSQASSGYTTPKQGLGAQRGGGGGGSGGGGRGMFGGGGRGGMIGGLGFHAGSPAGGVGRGRGRGRGGPVVGMGQGSFRPLLVPVSFVKASGLTPALDGDEDKAMTAEPVEEPQPGELEERVMQGSLVAEVRDLDLEDIESKELPLAAGAEDSLMDSEEAMSLEEDEEVQRALVASFAVQQQPREVEEEDSSEDEEQIVFHPQSAPLNAPPPAAAENEPDTPSSPPLFVIDTEPSPVTLADSSASSVPLGAPVPLPKASKESALPPPIPVAAPTPSPAPQSTKAKPAPHPQPQPQAKLTKGQKAALKKAGKKARKAGKAHARSGNRHLFAPAPDGYSDAEDAAEGEAMFEKMGAVDLSDSEEEDGDQAAEEMGAPRVGDSDLEWGSNGPQSDGEEDGGAPRASGKERKAARRQQRQEQKDAERMARLSMGARGQVDRALGQSSTQAEREAMTTAMGLKMGGTKGGKRGRKQIEILAAEDYERNVLGLEPDVEDEDEAMDLKAAESFARGLIGVKSGRQPTLDEMEDRARDELVASDGWRTSSGEDDDDESGKEDESDGESEGSDDSVDTGDEVEMDHSLAEADASVDLAIAAEEDALFDQDASFDSSLATSDEDAAIERALLAGGTIRLSSMGQTGSGGRRDVKERKRVAKGKGKQVVESESDSSDDDDAMFEGGNTWADNDEDYIRGVQEIIAANADLLERGGDRKARKKLFKAVEQGNFEDVDFDFEDDYALTAGPSKKKNKKVKPDFSKSAFDSDLEDQWSKDRSKKSEYKRQRALARAEAVDATSMSKKGPRAPPSFAGSSDAAFLDSRIRDFLLYDLSSPSMALPPMSKKSRVAVHLLAETYGMKSKSLGKGKARFPVLERTSRSTIYGVDERKIKAILGTAGGEREGGYHGGKAKGKMGGLWAALSGDGKKSGGGGGGGGGGKKNSEGAVVGQGADALGEGNIGFALLKKMGWTEGSQIGVSGGLSEPISARIKTSKSGLGSGYSVSRTEAQVLGKSNDQW